MPDISSVDISTGPLKNVSTNCKKRSESLVLNSRRVRSTEISPRFPVGSDDSVPVVGAQSHVVKRDLANASYNTYKRSGLLVGTTGDKHLMEKLFPSDDAVVAAVPLLRPVNSEVSNFMNSIPLLKL